MCNIPNRVENNDPHSSATINDYNEANAPPVGLRLTFTQTTIGRTYMEHAPLLHHFFCISVETHYEVDRSGEVHYKRFNYPRASKA